MRKIRTSKMVNSYGGYTDPLIFKKGFIVTRTFSLLSYIGEDNTEAKAVLPEIKVLKSTKESPIEVGGAYIISKSPSEIHSFSFKPVWDLKPYLNKDFFVFENSFIPQNLNVENIGHFVVTYENLTGNYDNEEIQGMIPHTGVSNRDCTYHGIAGELEKMVIPACQKIPSNPYDLKSTSRLYDFGDKRYSFRITHIKEFAAKVAEHIS